MSTLTETQRQQIDDMLTKWISPEDMARYARRFIHQSFRMMLQLSEDDYNKEWINDGYFYLNELCEILDPQLEEPPSEN